MWSDVGGHDGSGVSATAFRNLGQEMSVTLKGDDGQYKLAIWQQDGFAYSLNYEPGGSEDVFVEMIQSVQ